MVGSRVRRGGREGEEDESEAVEEDETEAEEEGKEEGEEKEEVVGLDG
jgi:hypothetical protein